MVGRRRRFDTDEVLTRSQEVFWVRGFDATSIEDITQATGLARSSIYAAFGSKRGLFDAVMERYLVLGIGEMLRPLEAGTDGLDDIIRFFEGWRDRIAREIDGSLGCLMVNTLAERGHIDPAIAAAGGDYLARLVAAFRRPLAVAGERGEIDRAAIPRRSEVLMLLTTGLFVASRGRERSQIETLLDAAVAELDSWRV